MKLVFDARPISQPFTGLGRYTASLLNALLSSSDPKKCEIDIVLDTSGDLKSNIHFESIKSALLARGRSRFCCIPVPAISLRQHFQLAQWINRSGGDHYFYPHFDLPLGVGVPSTFVVHDLIPLKVPGYIRRMSWAKKIYFRNMIRAGLRRAERCIVVSDSTRKDVLELVGGQSSAKIEVAYEGPMLSRSGAIESGEPMARPFLLYVGDRRPHKNVRRMLDVFVILRERYRYPGCLALVGSTKNYDFDVEKYIADRTDILVVGNVGDAELSWYYQNADALLLLSEYEGFGLPVVEAAFYNRKSVVSDGGSLLEIAPPSACIVRRQLSVSEAAAIIAEYLAQSLELDLSGYVDKFSWSKAAKRIFPMAY